MEHETQNIYLKDLIFFALHQWRKILLFVLVFGALLGIFSLAGQLGTQPYAASQAELDTAMEKYTLEKAALEKTLSMLKAQKDSQELYLKDSPFMQLDPYNVHQGIATVLFSAARPLDGMGDYEAADPTPGIYSAYNSCLLNTDTMTAAAKALDVDPKYLPSLLVISSPTTSQQSMQITVYYPTAEGAQLLLDILTKTVQEAQPSVQAMCGQHTLNILPSTVRVSVNPDIAATQKEFLLLVSTLNAQIADVQQSLGALTPPVSADSSSVSLKKVVLFAVIGAVVGAFLGILVCWLQHITDRKVYSRRLLENRTQVKVLECLPAQAQPHCRISRLEGRAVDLDRLDALCAHIRSLCDSCVLLAGSAQGQTRQLLEQKLAADGFKVISCGSLLEDEAAVNALADCQSVVLLEQCRISRYSQIRTAADRLQSQNKNLLGCVLLDG